MRHNYLHNEQSKLITITVTTTGRCMLVGGQSHTRNFVVLIRHDNIFYGIHVCKILFFDANGASKQFTTLSIASSTICTTLV